jgi:hypothetical protein
MRTSRLWFAAPDGKRLAAFLAHDEAGGQKPLTHLTFLLNFFDELRRRVRRANEVRRGWRQKSLITVSPLVGCGG